MNLDSWDTPQVGILSFQINAMDYYGTVSTAHSCVGLYQLGIDLNPGGYIAPWYVPGKNCVAHYFLSSQSPAVQTGVYTGPGTHLTLTIFDDRNAKAVVFTIVVTSPALTKPLTFTASRPYNGTEFYGTYTQLEFQPCCKQVSDTGLQVKRRALRHADDPEWWEPPEPPCELHAPIHVGRSDEPGPGLLSGSGPWVPRDSLGSTCGVKTKN
jgi:hypothetical protein